MPNFKTLTDEQLVRRTLSGEHEAFGILLERHFQALRAVALAYARTRTDADDLVQESCVKAFRSLNALRDGSRFLPWVIKTLIRIARDTYRKESRRTELRERFTQQPEASEPQPERDEMRAVVRRELATLDENHRVVLLLRYYSGREVNEIADALGISSDAAAKRLQRAREALGERLLAFIHEPEAERDTGKRVSSIMSVVATTTPAWTSAASTSTAGAGASVSLPTTLVAAAAVALITFLGVTLWINQPVGEDADAFVPGSTAVAAAIERSQESAESPAEPDRTAPNTNEIEPDPAQIQSKSTTLAEDQNSSEQGATLTIRVYDRDTGLGVPGAEVRIHPRPRIEGFDRNIVHTDGTGYATLDALPASAFEVSLWSAPDYHVESYHYRRHIAIEGPDDALDVEFELSKGITVSGVVVDENGRAIPGVRVSAHVEGANVDSDAETNHDGTFVLHGLAETNQLGVQPVKEGYALGPQGPITVPANGLNGLVLTMHPAASVSGVLVDANGKPVPDYVMYMHAARQFGSYTKGIERGTTAADGSFTVTGLWPGTFRFMIGVPKTGSYATLRGADPVEVEAGEHVAGLVVTFDAEIPAQHIAGRVLDTNRNPLRYVEVTAGYQWGSHRDYTDADGRFRIEHLTEGNHALNFWHDHYTMFDLKNVEARRDDIEVVLEARGAVAGTVVDKTTGEPIRDFSVLERSRNRSWIIDDATTRFGNPDGMFHLADVQAGTRSVQVSAPRYQSTSLENIVVQPGRTTDNLLIELAPSPVVDGVVLNHGGTPVANALIFQGDEEPTFVDAAQAGGFAHPAATKFYELSGKDGRFRVESIAANTQFIVAYHKIHGFAVNPYESADGDLHGLQLQLRPPAVFEGVVMNGGEPVQGVMVEVQGQQNTMTGETGRYQLTLPADTTFTLDVWGAERYMHANDVPALSGQTQHLDFDLTPADTRITGNITFNGRPPDPDLQIRITVRYELDANRGITIRRRCGADGAYDLSGAPPGLARIEIIAERGDEPGVSFPENVVEIADGADQILNFDLDPATLNQPNP